MRHWLRLALVGSIGLAGGVWLAQPAGAVGSCGTAPAGTCVKWTCNTNTGEWVAGAPLAVGTACSDGSLCTTADKCNGSGTCAGTPIAGINDGNVCTTDTCNAVTGVITHTALTNACCSAGTKLTSACCSAGAPLTSACCSAGTALTGTSCSDGNLCTGNDTCQAGACVGSAIESSCCQGGTGVTNACCQAGVPQPTVAGEACTYACYDELGRMTSRSVCLAGQTCTAACP